MKKLYALGIIVVLSLIMTSCERTYSCTCKVLNPKTGQVEDKYSEVSISSLSRKDYKNACKAEGDNCVQKKL